MKTLMICTQMEAAGVQVIAKNFLDLLEKDGNDAKIAFLYKKRNAFEESDKIVVLGNSSSMSVFNLLKISIRLYKLINDYRPECIIGFAHYSSPLACIIGCICGVKIRVANQTNPPHTHSRFSRILDMIAGVLPFYTVNICASKTIRLMLDNYPTAYTKKLVTVSNGVDATPSNLTKDDARNKFGIPHDEKILITCGRLSKQKNHIFLIELLKIMPNYKVYIAGDGELKPYLESMAAKHGVADRLILLGEIQPADIKDFLRCGDIFVFPSLYEAFGLAVVEAALSGIPVISSNHPALVEVLGGNGLTIELDLEKWKTEIINIIEQGGRSFPEVDKLFQKKYGINEMYKNYFNTIMARS